MEKITFSYDEESDIMYFSLGKPLSGIDNEIENGIFIRHKSDSNEVTGFMVIDFKKRFKSNLEYTIPISIEKFFIAT